jgi:hypothetical protein
MSTLSSLSSRALHCEYDYDGDCVETLIYT